MLFIGVMGPEKTLIDTAMDSNVKVFVVSTLSNVFPPQIYVWRNYQYPLDVQVYFTVSYFCVCISVFSWLPVACFFFFANFLIFVSQSRYAGTMTGKVWEAMRATSCAPGYFEEYTVGNEKHQVNTQHHTHT